MRALPLSVAICISFCLPGSTALALDDPPPSKPPSQSDKSPDDKKPGDNGLSDLLNGLAGQSLKVFMDPDLLKRIPGDNAAEKAANVQLLMGMIEGETIQEKFEVINALKKLQSDPSIQKPTAEMKKRLKDWYPILEQFAGADGYVNMADVEPIVNNVFDGSIRQMAVRTLPRIAARREVRGRKPVLADQESAIREASQGKLQQFLDKLGVPEETRSADSLPAKREIWPRVVDQLKEDGSVSIPKSLDFLKGLATLPPPPMLKDKVSFKNGLPVKKLEPFLVDGKIPKELRISFDKKTNVLVIR